MPPYPIDPARTALILFDMLNHYVHGHSGERKPGIAESGPIERAIRMLAAARDNGIKVAYANGRHRPQDKDVLQVITDTDMNVRPWPDGPRRTTSSSAVEGSHGAEVIDELAPRDDEYVIPKYRFSAFQGTNLDLLLRGHGVDTILLLGGSTEVGIVATAYNARDLGYNLIVLRDACTSSRPTDHDFCMERLFPRLARVMTVDQAIGLIGTPRAQSESAGGN